MSRNEAGVYTINASADRQLPVKMELQGFKAVTVAVDIAAGQTARMDAKLEVGSLTESVEVTATSAILQTENAVVGGKFDREQVERLPIQGRNLSTAALFTAGVTIPNPGDDEQPEEHGRARVRTPTVSVSRRTTSCSTAST